MKMQENELHTIGEGTVNSMLEENKIGYAGRDGAIEMVEMKLNSLRDEDLLGTSIVHERFFNYNAPHHFKIKSSGWELGKINFQEGPASVVGINGVREEDLLSILLCRLVHFQNSVFACRENAVAITKLEEAFMWLNKRTSDRILEKKEGTNEI